MIVSNLFRYPIKSCQGHKLEIATLDRFGIAGDRRFMLVDSEGNFLTQRSHPMMANIVPQVLEGTVEIRFSDVVVEFSLQDFTQDTQVKLWGDMVMAKGHSEPRVAEELSRFLGCQAHLVYMPDDGIRPVDIHFAKREQQVGFADGFPLLVCAEASLADLNSRLEHPIPMTRFRPNIVISGAQPFAESSWKRIRVGEVELDLVKPCSRCSITTLDPSGRFNKEPLRTLSTYRKNEFGACFGENACHTSFGRIRVGDRVEVLE